jgi:hypothetical protein
VTADWKERLRAFLFLEGFLKASLPKNVDAYTEHSVLPPAFCFFFLWYALVLLGKHSIT